jgi:hypothetical protein
MKNNLREDEVGRIERHKLEKELLLHVLFGTLIFTCIASAAVLLDLASIWVAGLGVSTFTAKALSYTSHALMVVDLGLFGVYLYRSIRK